MVGLVQPLQILAITRDVSEEPHWLMFPQEYSGSEGPLDLTWRPSQQMLDGEMCYHPLHVTVPFTRALFFQKKIASDQLVETPRRD